METCQGPIGDIKKLERFWLARRLLDLWKDFSAFGWVHSKERNRLGTEKAGKWSFAWKFSIKKWAFVELFPINFLLFVTLYFQASRKGNWVLKIDSMAKNEFQNSPHVLKTRYIMCWWHLNYILRHSQHLWIFTKVSVKNPKSWFKSWFKPKILI